MSQVKALPLGWKWVKLGEIGKVKGGKRLPKGELYSEEKTDHAYLRVTDFQNLTINQSNLKYLKPSTQAAIKNYTISHRDVFISIAGTIGQVGIIPHNLDGANLTENAAKITELKNISNKYLAWFLSSSLAQSQMNDSTIATTQPKLALYRIEKIDLPLPPLSIQAQIVEKLEALLSELEKGKAQLLTAQAQLKTYRQAVLKYAFEGKLTGEVEGWKWVKLGEVGKVKGGKRLPKGESYSEEKTNYPYIRVTDFQNMTVNQSNLKYLKPDTQKAIKNYIISNKDVFISIAGTIGQVGVIPEKLEGANLTENAAKITELKNISNKYLAWFLSSSSAQSQMIDSTIATTQPKLALFRIEKIDIPLPPLSTQQKIVTEIESRLSVCDKLEETLKVSLAQCETLRQSLLKRAFEGKLV